MTVGADLPQDVQATWCATLVDQWLALGVRHAVISPGSRSTPMALAITDRAELAVHVVHDERSAAFVALGAGLGGAPALLLCTSGTAAANFLPAVVEANLSEVPMIVLTADRPPELRGVGAPQTIDQIELYGAHVRWFHDPGVPDVGRRPAWRSVAADAFAHAAQGPVQLNLAFREPLLGAAGDLPPRTSGAESGSRPAKPSSTDRSRSGALDGASRGIVLVGGRSGVAAEVVAEFAARSRWPVVADPISSMRHLPDAIVSADSLLRSDAFAAAQLPDVILRVGRPAASKVLAQWTKRATDAGARLVQVGGPGVIDPDRNVSARMSAADLALVDVRPAGADWAASWTAADRLADAVIAATIGGFDEPTEPGVARSVARALPEGAELVVASSMPVRDLEWFGGRSARAHANRGANGIDGVLATALGRAVGGRSTFVLLGDLAFVHDSNALVGLAGRGCDLRIVVVDNDGGGIFSFLPQADALDPERFELLFGTPLGVDVVDLAAAYGVRACSADTLDQLGEQLGRRGPWVCRVRTDRRRNVEVHAELHAAVAAALAS
jgi:2-succinyl-5-enolpyruvyl-6-hydroxy-3-cyclohexene-1-carboxylate synthase